MSKTITAIDKASVHRITSGQVIVDLCSAVKELVENSLDAGATSVEIRLKEYGSELIEVADNGSGISPDDYEAIAMKYCTSKISSFEDVAEVLSFGFRGEALSSLCAVSSVTVTTKTATQDAGTRLVFDRSGKIAEKGLAARSPGTTVSIKDLFKTLPVRYKAFQKSIKKEYVKLVHLLQAYAVVCTNVRIIATNQVKKAARSTVVSTRNQPSIHANILDVFGTKVAGSLEPIDAENDSFKISGHLSSAVKTSGKVSGHPQFFFLNGRPVDLPKAVRIINDSYRNLSSPATAGCKAVFALAIEAKPGLVDVNVTPDKRTVMIQQEADLLELLRNTIEDLWDPAKWQTAQSLTQQQQAGSNQRLPSPARKTQQTLMDGHVSKAVAGSPDGGDAGKASVSPPLDSGPSKLTLRSANDPASRDLAAEAEKTGDVTPRTLPDAGGNAAEDNSMDQADKLPIPSSLTTVSPQPANDVLRRVTPAGTRKPSSSARGSLAAALSRAPQGRAKVSHSTAPQTTPAARSGTGLFIRSPGKAPKQLAAGTRSDQAMPASQGDDSGRDDEGPLNRQPASQGDLSDRDNEGYGNRKQNRNAPENQRAERLELEDESAFESDDDKDDGIILDDSSEEDEDTCEKSRSKERPKSVSCSQHPLDLTTTPQKLHTDENLQDDADPDHNGNGNCPADSTMHDVTLVKVSDGELGSGMNQSMQQTSSRHEDPPKHVVGNKQCKERCEIAEASGQDNGKCKDSDAKGARSHHETDGDVSMLDVVKPIDVDAVDTGTPEVGRTTPRQRDPAAASESQQDTPMGPPGRSEDDAGAVPSNSIDADVQPGVENAHEYLPPAGGSREALPSQRPLDDLAQHIPALPWSMDGTGRMHVKVKVASMARRRSSLRAKTSSDRSAQPGGSKFKASSLQALRADVEDQEQKATSELQGTFKKSDFRQMTIHGQFNHGFIMASVGRELFIVDQHAADEKSTFERLQDTLVLNKQPLIAPLDLGLPPVDDLTIRDNLDVFGQNGFGFAEDVHSGMLQLSSVPFSKGTTFGVDDVHEMIGMLHHGETTRVYVGEKRKSEAALKCRIRPTKVRAMLAMRACRSSIMVGAVLNQTQMESIVARLSELDGPWNCPHGRPTLRHACTIPHSA